MKTNYSAAFFRQRADASTKSAEVIAPLVLACTGAKTVVDVGCGTGTWLQVMRHAGVQRVLGIDGPWVDVSQLVIDRELFLNVDLAEPFAINDFFDLAISLEVAEHLPQSSAKSFVRSLTRLAPFVLFSAAVPGQGGTGHINEQWPPYWAALFQEHGYRCLDVIRPQVWSRPSVAPWYAQNTFLFASGSTSLSAAFFDFNEGSPLSVVHPRLFDRIVATYEERLRRELTVREVVRALRLAFINSLRRRLARRAVQDCC